MPQNICTAQQGTWKFCDAPEHEWLLEDLAASSDGPRRPVDALPSVVVNELTPASRAALQDHIVTGVIVTPLPQLCRTLVDQMIATIRNGPAETPGQIFLPFGLNVPESI